MDASSWPTVEFALLGVFAAWNSIAREKLLGELVANRYWRLSLQRGCPIGMGLANSCLPHAAWRAFAAFGWTGTTHSYDKRKELTALLTSSCIPSNGDTTTTIPNAANTTSPARYTPRLARYQLQSQPYMCRTFVPC